MKFNFALRILNTLVNNLFILIDKFFLSSPKIYMFHNITDEVSSSSELYSLSTKYFDFFLLSLIKRGDSSISLSDIKAKIITKNRYAITFDDAYAGVYNYAYPLLKKYKIPFTVFMSVSLIGKEGYLTEKQLKELANNELCTIGSHGIDHIYYRGLNNDKIDNQYNASKNILENITGRNIFAFAFPYGSIYACSIQNIKRLKNSGYMMGFSTIPVGLKLSFITGVYFLPRINVSYKYINSNVTHQ